VPGSISSPLDSPIRLLGSFSRPPFEVAGFAGGRFDFRPAPSRELLCRVPLARPRQFSRRRSPPRRGDHRRSASMRSRLAGTLASLRTGAFPRGKRRAAPHALPPSRVTPFALGGRQNAPCPSAPLRRRPSRAPLRSALNNKRAHCQIAAPARRSR